ncbi:MAG TPA: TetR/AcrR family transcriptional regulator [Deltaproteobacteria bacterium]|nr:TetR/AcrR family transcriptional regulator [Deltaproteobacteria bacterium]HPR55055.1 TetR/AcrR family transcriptional regulator [Deltaproteobacteria bacterium]HXK47892.1 TetR/AcrR family transcriptional regulator [Deltaproteobacteria bacterium]
MPGKRFAPSDIVDAAFGIIRRHGWDRCTARSIARELGSSTMPIYSGMKSMKNLQDEIARKASDLLIDYQTRPWSGFGFLDMGVGYVMFAQEEKNLFRMMYARESDEADDVDRARKYRGYVFDALMERLGNEQIMEGLTIEQRREVLSRMWVFSHGLAVLINNTIMEPMSEKEITDVLMDTGLLIIKGERSRHAGDRSGPLTGKIKGHPVPSL